MKGWFLTLLLGIVLASASAEVSITCVPGGLKSFLAEENLDKSGTLIVGGTINALDLMTLATLEVDTVDITSAKIEELTSINPLISGIHYFPANRLPDYVFGGSKVKNWKLPISLKEIGAGAFLGSEAESIAVPEGVECLGDYAMRDCNSLISLTLPSTVTTIGKECFAGCRHLETLNIKDTHISLIPERVVANCDALEAVVWPSTVTAISPLALADSKILSFRMTNAVNAAPFALAHTSLEFAHLQLENPQESTGILLESGALQGMDYAWSAVPAGAFAGINNAYVKDYAGNASSIGDYAFYDVVFSMIKIPEGVTSIGDEVLGNSQIQKIDAVSLKDKIPSVNENTFEGLNQADITLIVKHEYVDLWKQAEGWNRFKIVDEIEGVEGIQADFFSIDYNNSTLYLTSESTIMQVNVVDEQGHLLAKASPNSSECELPVTTAGGKLLIVTTKFPNSLRTDKIIIP